jgi:hypothetical protein
MGGKKITERKINVFISHPAFCMSFAAAAVYVITWSVSTEYHTLMYTSRRYGDKFSTL